MDKARTDYKRAFNEKAYDRLAITIPKGRKQTVETIATARGQSVNGLVNELLRGVADMDETGWKTIKDE